MIAPALLLTLLAAGPPLPAPSAAPALASARMEDPQAALEAQYEKLQQESKDAALAFMEQKKADPKTPRWELGMWDKYQALADKGHGRSLLWLALNAQHKVEGKKEITARKLELFGQLVARHADAEWATGIVDAVTNQKKYFGMPEMDKLLSQLKSASQSREVQAAALQALTKVLSGTAAGESERKRVAEYQAALEKDYQGTRVVDRMHAAEFREKNLAVGKPVPDFTAKDVEGVEFKLSDYKGKVVLLDFWGFW